MKREEHAGKTEKRSETDEDGLVSSVLSDFSESDGSRHEQRVNPLSVQHTLRTRMCCKKIVPFSFRDFCFCFLGCF